jgi:hypothetical protein
MRRWFKVSPARCQICGDIRRSFRDILREGRAYDDGSFVCGPCTTPSRLTYVTSYRALVSHRITE